MTRIKLIAGIIFGGMLAILAVWIGVRSLGEALVPQNAFALIEEIPISTSTTAIAHVPDYAAVRAQPKKTLPKPEPIIIPPSPILAPIVVTPVVLPAPQPTPAPVPTQSTVVIPQILISEVFVGTEISGEDEFIELYNAGQQSVDLTGWSINKKTASGKEDNLVAKARLLGKTIAPNQHFLLVHDSSSFAGAAPDALWAKSNTIAAKNNAIILYNSAGVKVDEASWPEIPKGSSYARSLLMEGGHFSIQHVPSPKE